MPNALERLKGIKQGDFSTRDVLPKRFMMGESGEAFSLSKEVYYRLRGWSGEGRPTVNKLAELDLV
jgi:aldehyde:ferredoxin oxidoreductase